MKCPSCGYNSFDYRKKCRKCGGALSPTPIFTYLYEDNLATELAMAEEAASKGRFSSTSRTFAEDDGEGFRDIFSDAGELASAQPAGEFINTDVSEKIFDRDFTLPERASESGKKKEKTQERSLLPPGHEAAGLSARLFAFLIDLVFVFAAAATTLLSGAYLMEETAFSGFGEVVDVWGKTCLYVYLLATTYFVFLPSLSGNTLGNAAMGIRIVNSDGSETGSGQNLAGWICYLFSTATFFITSLAALFDMDNRSLMDRIRGTFVVLNPPEKDAD